jgi:HPt (histidine-containing phosphotransfer) domain-containing protein
MNEEIALLDQAVVSELRESVGGDNAFVVELVGAYLAEGQDHIDAMLAAAAGGDAAAIVRPSHTLKSSSASLGAMRLAAICRGIEMAGREGRSEGLAAQVSEAQQVWHETVAALKAAGLAP